MMHGRDTGKQIVQWPETQCPPMTENQQYERPT